MEFSLSSIRKANLSWEIANRKFVGSQNELWYVQKAIEDAFNFWMITQRGFKMRGREGKVYGSQFMT